MKYRKFLFVVLFIISVICLFAGNRVDAATLDEIENYIVTVDPRMNDGSLDITYEITWKVLDSTTEGPLEWVSIGTPNQNFDTPTAITSNIKKIQKYNGAYVRVDFDRKYYEGEEITFKYSIHQSYIYTIKQNEVSYSFTPAWFTDAEVKSMTIRWNQDKVKQSDKTAEDGNYLTWSKTNMSKGSKMTATVKYEKTAFTSISESKQVSNVKKPSSGASGLVGLIIGIIVFYIIIVFLSAIFGGPFGGGYYGHRGFYGGGWHHHYWGGGGCAHSSCAHSSCAHSSCAHSSCACACAGSGRAGCSKKDFYGTNLTSKKIKNGLK